MKDVKIIFEHPENCKIGDRLYWILGPDSFTDGTISAFGALIVPHHKDGLIAIPQTVRLSIFGHSDYFKGVNWDAVPLEYLTKDKAKALLWSLVFPVECSDDDWLKAIGRRQTYEEIKTETKLQMKTLRAGEKWVSPEDPLETCELSICCASTSHIRDILLRCQEKKSLIGWEVEQLKSAIKHDPHDVPEDAPILTNILKQLGITWR